MKNCKKQDCRYYGECGIEFGSEYCDYELFTQEEKDSW